jgi:lipid II:glycine glycyltransferase (peptidoglycan interpeptide bridge formation enzyme)
MTAEWLKQYLLIESCRTEEGLLSIWHSPGNSDASWDEFLMKTSMGQFQQSSMWAQVKEVEGWECLRVVATLKDQIAGGFQILWRNTRFGRIGYVSKGPVAVPETQWLIERLVALMCKQARKDKILALVVQPPDDSKITSDILGHCRFIQSNPMDVIETTLLVDVSNSIEALDKGMNRKTRKNVRLANHNGITIREGTEKDIGLFFNLMIATCNRQGVKPNPPTEKALRQLWLTFSKHNCLLVTFAEYNHEVLAGSLNIVFGKKVNLWKKGWNFNYPDRYPNDLLYYDILHWACSNKFNHCDFIAFDRSIADALQKGAPLSDAQEKSRHIFNLRFGGMPKLLPSARIWIANPLIRFGYENVLIRLARIRHLPIPNFLRICSGSLS